MRQQVREVQRDHSAVLHQKYLHLRVELDQELPTGATRRAVYIAAPRDCYRKRVAFSGRNCARHRRTLCTDGEAITRVFDIASPEDGSISHEQRSPDGKTGVRRVRPLPIGCRHFHQGLRSHFAIFAYTIRQKNAPTLEKRKIGLDFTSPVFDPQASPSSVSFSERSIRTCKILCSTTSTALIFQGPYMIDSPSSGKLPQSVSSMPATVSTSSNSNG